MKVVYCVFREEEVAGIVSYKLMKVYKYESLAKARVFEYVAEDNFGRYHYEAWEVQD